MKKIKYFDKIEDSLKKAILSSDFMLKLDHSVLANNPKEIIEKRKHIALSKKVEIPKDIIIENRYIKDIRVIICKNKNATNTNVVLHFHGGGYIFGLPEQDLEILCKLADNLNITIIGIDYSLKPYPSPLNDAFTIYKECLKVYKNIILYGISAGAHLCLALQYKLIDSMEKLPKFSFLFCPMISDINTNSLEEFEDFIVWDKKCAEISWNFIRKNGYKKYINLLNFGKLNKLNNLKFVICELDILRDEALEYIEKLKQANVKHTFTLVRGAIHAFSAFKCKLSDEFYSELEKDIYENLEKK
ncbi:alpha/beta hydrolase family protein [Campylobacter blaseri]|uniref:Alpha/beta hydrolase fold-3 domain-containing protein n=1 Tax=Campylobacter blaseri TaxID=2042961 RepID=A0A2P8R3W5_9BACT|nr:alpha/beta hydrolase [Campylobacter blaseri]PSM53207.1 hypothetical protein CQ405_01270 [Campylobacter blaseri]PSM54673.1 hypothetical protein CRN67_01270 [Campylobacter blaseri]QKF86850.1 alpha/beta hydrolase family protein [Campylobacter blaseri]